MCDFNGADTSEGGFGDQVGRATVEQRIAREGQRAIEREGILTRADEGRGALNLAGPGARIVILIHDERTTSGAGDDAVDVRDRAIAKERVGVLDLAVQVEGATRQREVVVRLDGVVREELHRTVVDHELAAKGVRALSGETVDRGEGRLEGEGAGAGLDGADVAVGDAVTAVEGRDEVKVANRPEVERREVAGLIEDAAGEDRGADAVTDKDTAALQRKADAGGQGQTGAGLNRE